MPERAKLIFACGESSADLFYACGFRAPDPFAFLLHKGTSALLLNDLELDRGRAEARVDRVDSVSEIAAALALKPFGAKNYPAILSGWLESNGVRSADVPGDFPLGLATDLKKHGLSLFPQSGHFWPGREIKTPQEISSIRAALRITEAGMERALEILRASKIRRDGGFLWNMIPLTSERLRAEIDTSILHLGGRAEGTIVAGGDQACDPHGRGSGILRARELIILDIFPRDTRTGFYGDLTRTVVKGRATARQRHLWETCLEGQKFALRGIRPGADGSKIHAQVQRNFTLAGYPTEKREGRWCGFFHGTGHGLGLEVHEDPRFAATCFRPGQVLTVEPGLYYPGIGGVRHEDVIAVTSSGKTVLSRFTKALEIP